MKTYNEILKQKVGHYGDTKAAYEFAAEEYADQFKPKWISVEGYFPDNGLIVDIFHPEKGRICNVSVVDDQFIDYSSPFIPAMWLNITHWMPLPTPPTQ